MSSADKQAPLCILLNLSPILSTLASESLERNDSDDKVDPRRHSVRSASAASTARTMVDFASSAEDCQMGHGTE